MRARQTFLAWLLPTAAAAQTTLLGSETTSGTTSSTGVNPNALGDALTSNVTYISYSSTITRSATASLATGNTSNSLNQTITSSSSMALTELVGGTRTASGNGTASSTSSSARPTNTQPCNGYVEFCERSYSNISYVAAHNFAFTRKNNAARNQELDMITQLNDGIRMLQVQAHYENGTVYFCHTSCDILNAGTMQSYFVQLVDWLNQNPFEVVTLLIGNYNQDDVSVYVPPIQDSGLESFLYEPPKIPMGIDDWPTTAELIITNKRVVYFMDYKANQTKVPYILDEFSQVWETPFSPTDPAFPCTIQRPPGLSEQNAKNRMYLANHNLNVDLTTLGVNILVPNVAQINQTNGVTGNQSLGAMANECTADYTVPPNFLLVDFYNYGDPSPGSVFEVAARLNNVTYNGQCCGKNARSDAVQQILRPHHFWTVFTFLVLIAIV